MLKLLWTNSIGKGKHKQKYTNIKKNPNNKQTNKQKTNKRLKNRNKTKSDFDLHYAQLCFFTCPLTYYISNKRNQFNSMYTFYQKLRLAWSLPVNVFNTFVKFVAGYSQDVNATTTEGKNDSPVLV